MSDAGKKKWSFPSVRNDIKTMVLGGLAAVGIGAADHVITNRDSGSDYSSNATAEQIDRAESSKANALIHEREAAISLANEKIKEIRTTEKAKESIGEMTLTMEAIPASEISVMRTRDGKDSITAEIKITTGENAKPHASDEMGLNPTSTWGARK